MKNIKFLTKMKCFTWLAMAGLTLSFATSCNKDFDNLLTGDYSNDSLEVSAGKKKVLYLILDGVRGSVLASMKPTTIMQINRNATYSFAGLNDSIATLPTNASSWTDMLTGVNQKAHKVTGSDFTGNNLVTFPTIFKRLKDVRPNFKTVSYAASVDFDANLATDASEHKVFTTDAEVKNSLLADLANTDASLVLAQFHSADVAGATGGYNESNIAYKNAITTLDGYLREILDGLAARPNYTEESWLVVVASNKGGQDVTAPTNDISLFGSPEKNTYVAFFNTQFSNKAYNKPNTAEIPFSGKAPRFKSTASGPETFATLANTTIGNFGNTGDYTMMFKIRVDESTNQSWPQFMGKSASTSDVSSNGWQFAMSGASFQFDYGNSTRPNVTNIRDAQWHTIAVKFYMEAGKRFLTMFVDANKLSVGGAYPLDITSKNPANTTYPLRLGSGASKPTNFLMRDLVIFNVAISDADINTYMRREIQATHPYFANMIGWWPMEEGEGTLMKDASGKGNHFTLNSANAWTTFSDLTPNVVPALEGAAYRIVPNNVDLPFQIYNWLGVLPDASWSLTGRGWSPTYLSLTTN